MSRFKRINITVSVIVIQKYRNGLIKKEEPKNIHALSFLYPKLCWKGKNKIGNHTPLGGKYCSCRVRPMTLIGSKTKKIEQWNKIVYKELHVYGMIYNGSDITGQSKVYSIFFPLIFLNQ